MAIGKDNKTVQERAKEYKKEIEKGVNQKKRRRHGERSLPSQSVDAIEDFVGQRIEQAMREGHFDNLPGRGKPLNLRKHDHVPDDMQMAFNLLEDNNLTPSWISKRKSVLDSIDSFRQELRDFSLWYQAESEMALEQIVHQKLVDEYRQSRERWGDQLLKLNRRIGELNIEQPLAHLEILKLRLEDELTRVDLS